MGNSSKLNVKHIKAKTHHIKPTIVNDYVAVGTFEDYAKEAAVKVNFEAAQNFKKEKVEAQENDDKPWWEVALGTLAVVTTTVTSGIAKVVENVVDGAIWVGGAVASGACRLVGADDAAESVENWTMDVTAYDAVGELNKAFYEGTDLGRAINDASAMKYDSELAKGIQSAAETAVVIAGATAATIATGGAAAPIFAVGALQAAGASAEEHFKDTENRDFWTDSTFIAGEGVVGGLSAVSTGKIGATVVDKVGKKIAQKTAGEATKKLSKGMIKEKVKTTIKEKVGKEARQAIRTNIKQNWKKIATSSAKNALKSPGTYIEAYGSMEDQIKTGVKTGNWDIGAMALAGGGELASGLLSDAGKDAFSMSTKVSFDNSLALTGASMHADAKSDAPNLPSGGTIDLSSGAYSSSEWKSYLEGKYGKGEVEHVSGIGAYDVSEWKSYLDDKYGVENIEHVSGKTTVMSRNLDSYKNLDKICSEVGITPEKYLELSRTPQHKLNGTQRKVVFEIRSKLTSSSTTSDGMILPGKKVSKAIGTDVYNKFYQPGSSATVGGCVALASDSDGLFESGGAEAVIYGLGLDYEGTPFVNSSGGKKQVNDFYIVEGDYDPSGASIYTRYSATTDYVSPEAGGNDVWDQNARSQVPRMLGETGARGIVVEDKNWYNTEVQPDRGLGITLDQQNGARLGAPEFLCGSVDENGVISQGGRANLRNGAIYKISGGKKIQVSKIVNGKVVKIDE